MMRFQPLAMSLCAVALLASPAFASKAKAPDTSGQAAADAAGNRMEALTAPKDGDPACTADGRWCARIAKTDGAGVLNVFDGTQSLPAVWKQTAPEGGNGDTTYALWPWIIREAAPDTVLVGVEVRESAGYSGGGANATHLTLYRLRAKGAAADWAEATTLPWDAYIMIRACFSEADMKKRADVCHDEYTFAGSLRLDPAVKAGRPRFTFQTRATSFPGKVSRSADSLEAPPLKKKDIVQAVDPACTYRRVLTVDAATGRYVPDRPEPECTDYMVP